MSELKQLTLHSQMKQQIFTILWKFVNISGSHRKKSQIIDAKILAMLS